MANTPPSWLPEAVPTSVGWAHPLTGEQLTATSGLEDAVDFYQPNARNKSFIDPDGEENALVFSLVRSNRVQFSVHTLLPVEHYLYTFGDGATLETTSNNVVHLYPSKFTDEEYDFEVEIRFQDGDPESLTLSIEIPGNPLVPSGIEPSGIDPSGGGDPGDEEDLDNTGDLG